MYFTKAPVANKATLRVWIPIKTLFATVYLFPLVQCYFKVFEIKQCQNNLQLVKQMSFTKVFVTM